MTERSFVSATSGPIVLGLSLPVGSIRVQIDKSVTIARVVLRTDDSTGPAADAVNRARYEQNGQVFGIEVPEMPNGVIVQGRGNHGSTVYQSFGSMNIVGGTVRVNGRVVSGGMGNLPTVSPIDATVYLPVGSSFGASTTSADAEVFGQADRVEFRSVSGDLYADGVRQLTVNTTSGDVSVGRVTDQVTAHSVSGDVKVQMYDGHSAQLNTTSGDVAMQATATASGVVSAHSISGDVRIAGARHLSVSARSVSGRVRNG